MIELKFNNFMYVLIAVMIYSCILFHFSEFLSFTHEIFKEIINSRNIFITTAPVQYAFVHFWAKK